MPQYYNFTTGDGCFILGSPKNFNFSQTCRQTPPKQNIGSLQSPSINSFPFSPDAVNISPVKWNAGKEGISTGKLWSSLKIKRDWPESERCLEMYTASPLVQKQQKTIATKRIRPSQVPHSHWAKNHSNETPKPIEQQCSSWQDKAISRIQRYHLMCSLDAMATSNK